MKDTTISFSFNLNAFDIYLNYVHLKWDLHHTDTIERTNERKTAATATAKQQQQTHTDTACSEFAFAVLIFPTYEWFGLI